MSYNSSNNCKLSKQCISEFKINKDKIEINKNSSNVQQDVFLELGNLHPEYSDFFTDLIVNYNQYLISGADFSIPVDPDGESYNVIIIPLSTNENYTGKLVFTVTLLPKHERIDISKYDGLFEKDVEDKMALITVNKTKDNSEVSLSKDEALQAIDSFFVQNSESAEWHSTKNKNLLYDNRNQIEVSVKPPYKTNGYTDGYFKIIISPMDDSAVFMPKILTAYVHEIVDFKSVEKSVGYNSYEEISSNWSTDNEWSWENENIWFKAIDVRDYLTIEEKNESQGNYKKAFLKKFNNFTFFTDGGYATDYNNKRHYLQNQYILSLSEYNEETNNSVKETLVSYSDTGFGVYNSIGCYVEFKFLNQYELSYHIHAHLGVRGFSAKWQHTSMSFSINKWIIS